ncbi:MAG TPA: diacylglycerol kinase family protein, partial [Coriobacteriia bacterium]|nr:diacylglycerol kinase family protein [Coriobacteriia bacterium]
MRVLIVVNPRSGMGDAGLYEYIRELGLKGVELTLRFVTTSESFTRTLSDADTFDRIVAVGGDGTVSGVAYGAIGSGVPVLPYPAGTANLFALNMKLPVDPLELARLTIEGDVREVDIGEISFGAGTRRGFIVAAGAGFDATIMEAADRLKPTLGPIAYVVGALQNLTPAVARFTLTIDGRTVTSEGIAALVMNVSRIQFDLALTHTSDPSDGMFEVVIVRTRHVPGLIPTVWDAFLDRFVQKPDNVAG